MNVQPVKLEDVAVSDLTAKTQSTAGNWNGQHMKCMTTQRGCAIRPFVGQGAGMAHI